MPPKRKSAEEIEVAEKQIKESQIPYEYDTKEFPIEVVLGKFNPPKNGEATLYIPHYQRQFVWKPNEQSRFIESVFLGVPIPPIFAATNEEKGTLEIIDGSQRIRTLNSFVSGELKLRELKKLTALNGFKFEDIPAPRQNKFLLISIRFHVVTEKADATIRADIFDRINTTGKKLSPSEIRKGALAGPFYDLVIELSKDTQFLKICPISKGSKGRGEAEELILRFFTYSEKYLEFKHDVYPFLDAYVLEQNQGFNKEEKSKHFKNMLSFIEKYFKNGFGKTATAGSTPRVRFEAIAVGTYLALQKNPELQPQDMSWLESKEFKDHTTTDASNNPGKLKNRVEFVRDKLLGLK
jgi:hypothetical protein